MKKTQEFEDLLIQVQQTIATFKEYSNKGFVLILNKDLKEYKRIFERLLNRIVAIEDLPNDIKFMIEEIKE